MQLRSYRTLMSAAAFSILAVACTNGSESGAPPPTQPPTADITATTEPQDARIPGTPETIPAAPELSGVFQKLSEPGVGGRITSIAFRATSRDSLLVGGDMLGIARTESFGDAWLETSGLSSWEIGSITTEPSADGRLWAGSLSGPHASADGGGTWISERNGMPPVSDSAYSLAIETILIDPSDSSRLVAFNGNQRDWDAPGAYVDGIWDGDGSVWQSLDSGESWTRLGQVSAGVNIRSAVFLGQSQSLIAATDAGIFASNDGGSTWFTASEGLPHTNGFDVTSDISNPARAWVALGVGPQSEDGFAVGGIWRTDDAGSSWTSVSADLNIISNATESDTGSFHQVVSAPSDPNRLYTSNVAPGQAAIYRSDNGGDTWEIIADGSTRRPNAYGGALRAFDIAVHPDDADVIAIGSDEALLGSTDGGQLWKDLTTLDATRANHFSGRGYSGLVSTDVVFDPRDSEQMILLGFDGGNFIQSTDDGASWRRTVQPVSPWGGGIEAAFGHSSVDDIYVVLGQFENFRGIGVSSDGGATFALRSGQATGLPDAGNVPGGAQAIAVAPGTEADVVFVVVGNQLYRSLDAADTFAIDPQLAGVTDIVVATGGDMVFASTSAGVFSSPDNGSTWSPMAGSPQGLTALRTAVDGSVYGVGFRTSSPGVHVWRGDTWVTLLDDAFAHDIAVDRDDPTLIAVVTHEPAFHDISNASGVYMSSDAGATFTIVNDGLSLTRARAAEFDPSTPGRLVIGTAGRGFYEVSVPEALAG